MLQPKQQYLSSLFKDEQIKSVNVNIKIIDNRAHEDSVPTVIEKSMDRERFFDTKLILNDCHFIKEAGYKQDYNKFIKNNNSKR